MSDFLVFFVRNSPLNQSIKKYWVFQKICNEMGTKILEIDGKMSEITEPKIVNPKNSVSKKWAISSHP